MKKRIFYLLLVILLTIAGCWAGHDDVDGLLRSRVDALNKVAFTARFNDAVKSESYARQALAFVNDSLPTYNDGRLRAWNILATSFFNRSMHDSVSLYVDSVLSYRGQSRNRDMEKVLARLLKARLLQRQCDIAGCYQILYDIEQSGLLDKDNSDMLVSLAKSEFFIATNTLNYHYRNKSQYEQAELLVEMEQQRSQLHCDYAEDMSFNYAIAYGYYALCSDTVLQSDYLAKALHYCDENLQLLGKPSRYSTYHLANTYQLLGSILWSKNISDESWRKNSRELITICDYIKEAFGFEILNDSVGKNNLLSKRDGYSNEQTNKPTIQHLNSQLALSFLREATSLFFLHDDPYQRLGAIISTGRCCLAQGDTVMARNYFNEALLDTTMLGVAPKFEAMLYEGFLIAGSAENLDEVARWTRKELDLLNYIKQNEKADFILQQELSRTHHSSAVRLTLAIVLALLTLALLITLFLLRRRTKALQRETAQLQEANERDVERIANVETCLSVLRHDITPFVSYLQNDKLPDELRSEVTSQLIRTFENIKNWTKLSIPSGLQFRKSTVQLQEIFDNVSRSIMVPQRIATNTATNNESRMFHVKPTFIPTDISVNGDCQLIEILLRNLVNNAIQHTEQGDVTVKAEIYAEDARFAHVTVSDSGCGMTPEQLESLFRSDKKIKPTPEAGYGSGFGLMLCRYIIKLHDDNTIRGCRIWAESEIGKGSVFHFLLSC